MYSVCKLWAPKEFRELWDKWRTPCAAALAVLQAFSLSPSDRYSLKSNTALRSVWVINDINVTVNEITYSKNATHQMWFWKTRYQRGKQQAGVEWVSVGRSGCWGRLDMTFCCLYLLFPDEPQQIPCSKGNSTAKYFYANPVCANPQPLSSQM